MLKKDKVLSLLLALAIFSNVGIAYAEGVDDLKDKQKEVKAELKETKEKKEEKEKELADVKKEIDKLDNEINEATKKIQEVESRMKKVLGEISISEKELEEAQKNIEEKNETLGSRLRVMYKTGNVSYLEVLFGAESFSDLLSRLDLVQRVANQDVELLRYMQQQRKIIEDKKEELEKQQTLLEHQQAQVKIQKEKLQLANRSKQVKMDKLRKEHSQLENLEDKLNKEANSITNEIQNLQNPAKEAVAGEYVWPVPGKNSVSSPFGYRTHPIFGTRKFHSGIDISYGGQYGPTVVATKGGTVIFAGWKTGYGNTVMIDHGGKVVSLYAHNQSLLVSSGQNVNAGQAIAKGGSTGYSTGPHLHFEIRKNGNYVNPYPLVR